jgi:pyruvate,water dikinase
MSRMAYTFDELPPELLGSAGGKGSTLARLYQTGYPVPAGFVVLPSAFVGEELVPEAWAQVRAHLERLSSEGDQGAFAVRSSALVEDSLGASFAGEFDTVLEVRTEEEVRAAILRVRQSWHADRVRVYSEARGLGTDHELAVVVQHFVPADLSGILFTADPVTGSRSEMKGNFVHGTGEKLVSGTVAPLEFRFLRPRYRYEGPDELKPRAKKLYKLGKRLERQLGGPQDVEWAIAGRKVYVLQSRPITTLEGFNPATGEFNDSLTGDYVWSSVNVGEAVSVVMTPLTWSTLLVGFSELNVLPGYASVGNIGGRFYQNVTVMLSVLQALGRDIREVAKEMGGVRDEYLETMDLYMIPLQGIRIWDILPQALRVRRKEKQALRNADAFIAGNPGWCLAVGKRIQAVGTEEELTSLLEKDILPHSLESVWYNYATALRQSELVSGLRKELLELAGAADADALLSNLSSDVELLASLGPVVGLAQVNHGEMTRQAYLEQWGHRGANETELSAPRPAEDPGWLDEQLAAFAKSPVDVEGLLAAQRARFETAWTRFQERYPGKAKSIRRRLDLAAAAARSREAARSESARVIGVARTWALRAGELTGLGDAVFYLLIDELLDLMSGREAPTAAIPARRKTYERYKALPPLPVLIRGRFDPFQWAADPNRPDDVFDSHGLLPKLRLEASSPNVILGMPGSAGCTEGVVRLLDRPEDGNELRPGEILVASQTNIGWTFLFPRAAAIVTDIGAPLSHAAIVARELGIPAVVNCADATKRLQSGDRVRVDGDQGIVEVLPPVGGEARFTGTIA